MSNVATGRRSITPRKQRARPNLQQKNRNQEDVFVRTSLPPSVEGPVYATLICHIPKVRWNPKHQSLSRSVTVKVAWWGEEDTSALFKPEVSGVSFPSSQPLSTTAKYYVRSELKQFARYLTDAAELVLRVHDCETNRHIGTAKIQNLSLLSISTPIKSFQSIFTNKGEKIGEIFVSLRLILPGAYDSNENLAATSVTSDISNPSSRRNSAGTNDYSQKDQFDHGAKTYKLDRALNEDNLRPILSNDKRQHFDSTTPFKAHATESQLDVQNSKEQPTGKVVEALIERANRLREDMIKSTSQKPTTPDLESHSINSIQLNTNNNAENFNPQYDNKLIDIHENNIDTENICDLLGIKPSDGDLNNSNESIITDLDGLENEQSLLDELLYGDKVASNNNNNKHNPDPKNKTYTISKHHLRKKPPTGRSPSPNLSRVGGLSNRSRSTRSRSLAHSSDSDTASRVSFDLPSSDLDDSGNESHDDDSLSAERIKLLSYVRTARVRLDELRLNVLNNGRESPSPSSFGRTNKSKRALTYFIEYQFPVIANSRDGPKHEATQVMKIASKRFETNNDIIFSHLSAYPCLLTETIIKNWSRSLLVFKIFSRTTAGTNPEQIGFAVLPLRNVLKADSLHFEQNLSVIDRTQINQQKIPNQISKKFSIGHLHVMIELDSDAKNFKLELDRIRLIEQNKPKKKRTGKTKKIKKSKQILVNPNNNVQLPRAFSSEGFMANESYTESNDGLVVQIYLSIVEARNILQASNNNNLPRNPYFVCRAFWNEEPIISVICWNNSSPKFNFEQKIPLLLTKSTLEKMHNNFIVIELWNKKTSGPADKLIGIVKIPLEQFYISFKDKHISQVLLRAQFPVISVDSWLPIIDPFTPTNKSNGEIQVLLAMGTSDQITTVKLAHNSNESSSSSTTHKKPSTTITSAPNNDSSSLIEHHFEVLVESINGLRAFESMVWGESDCFIQYSFPVQEEQRQSLTSMNLTKPFQLRPIRTAATLCTSDPTFHDTNKFRYILSPIDALHKFFYAACQTPSSVETCIQFEVWSRFYYPNIRDQLLAKGKLPAAKLCSMTTLLTADSDNKSTQSFQVPLQIVQDDSKYENHRQSSASIYGGDLSITVTYKRNIIQKNERQAITDRLANQTSQVCISVGVVRACGLKHAALSQARHDARLNYPSQVGLNTFARLSLSFLSNTESRTTRTIARSFVPEFNHSVDFPIPLIWKDDNRSQTLSLAEILEHGELKIDICHQISSANELNQPMDKRPLDIHLCYCTISLKDLLARHTGIKGWFPLASANRVFTSDKASDPSEHCVGGLELSVRFGQQDDRSRVINSAKTLGWLDDNYLDEENFLDDQKDLGCLITVSVDRIQFPIQLATRPGKDRIDDRTSVFVQYRLYDKMPIITKRKKPIVDRNNVICELKFTKDHLFLCSAPFLWYLREEKLEIQIWMSDNDSYDYSEASLSSTDRLIGSIYVDLNSLCNRKRKSHRLSAILPLFKHGVKDLGGAFAQVHVTIDKSKDFNELRARSDLDTTSVIQCDNGLETHHVNSIANDRALRTTTNSIFSVVINIEQAAHLPTVYSKHENAHIVPSSYVTYSIADSHHLCRTQVSKSTCKPIWNHQQSVKLPVEHLFNDKKPFILKVWHKVNADIETMPEKSGDKVLGFVSIDLSPLLSGLQQISGWYNIVDTIGNTQGQLKISIVPQEDLTELKRFKYNSNPKETYVNTYRSTSTTSGNLSSRISSDLSARTLTGDQTSLNSSMVEDDKNKKSFLMNNLHRQLGELDVITERLKARLYSGSEVASARNTLSLTIPTNRCQSVPLPSSMLPLNLSSNTNSFRQEIDSTRSTTTTIQTDLSGPCPESLSGRPFMSNGRNVTDILSTQDDQVHHVEVIIKEDQVISTPESTLNKTSPPRGSPLLTIEEKRSSPSSPPKLPNFNSTTEFHPIEPSVSVTQKTPEHMNDSSAYEHKNTTTACSDEQDDQQHQSFLPTSVPATQLRSETPAIEILSPKPTEEIVTHQKHSDDIDVVHTNVFTDQWTSNPDHQQTNIDRLNDNSSPKQSARRNIFSTAPIVDDQQNEQMPSSLTDQHKKQSPREMIERHECSPSPSEMKQSFTSDSSIIDANWVEQQRQNDRTTKVVPSSTLEAHSNTKQPPDRSLHLAFLDLPRRNFFPSEREMEASIKHISHTINTEHSSSTTSDNGAASSSSSSSDPVLKTTINRLRGKSSVDNPLLQQPYSSEATTENVTRFEKIFKTKYTTGPPST